MAAHHHLLMAGGLRLLAVQRLTTKSPAYAGSGATVVGGGALSSTVSVPITAAHKKILLYANSGGMRAYQDLTTAQWGVGNGITLVLSNGASSSFYGGIQFNGSWWYYAQSASIVNNSGLGYDSTKIPAWVLGNTGFIDCGFELWG